MRDVTVLFGERQFGASNNLRRDLHVFPDRMGVGANNVGFFGERTLCMGSSGVGFHQHPITECLDPGAI